MLAAIKRGALKVCHSERSVSGVEESSHFAVCGTKIGAKILRLVSLAQDDKIGALLLI